MGAAASSNAALRRRGRLEAQRSQRHIAGMKTVMLTVALGGILAVVMFGVLTDWDASAMSIHGWIALALGTFLSLAVGGGLMALVFHSARKGYDDRIEMDRPEDL
jgi:hypothetical protein